MLSPTRRQLLLGIAAAPLVLSMGCSRTTAAERSTRPLPIPPQAESTVVDGTRIFVLRAMSGNTEIQPGVRTATWGFNGSILGPTLRARRGEQVAVRVQNELAEPTTVHWHGMHVPAQSDGGPHQTVPAGGSWEPRWQIKQPAATLWYHPHPHGATEKHIYRGLAGLFLIDDDTVDGLPRDYGIDDIPLIVQDRRFTAVGALDESDPTDIGLLGDTILTNGITGAHLPVTTQHVRLRLLNGSGGRLYNFGFGDDRRFHIIAGDGGLLGAPVEASRVQLSPGERAEIVVGFRPGESVALQSFPIENRAGLDDDEAARFGVDDAFTVLAIHADDTLGRSPVLPATLAALPALPDDAAAVRRQFDLQWFMINRNRMDMNRIDFHATVDTDEIWTVRNVDNWPHNFHVHDTQFRIIDIDGAAPPAHLAGFKDTVYIAPAQRIRIAVRFTDYTDPTWPYMYHCHLAWHEDQGMMGQFLVLGPGQQPAGPPATPMAGHAMR
ncbi:MAG: multicopper oxidase domain-containing protein [Mycolicibacterium neoaurum]|uniref:multicopper oxidase family protein n=1 Tax=Mycolicibacterium neoaurum TaxID=1795 RepID=UPI001BCEA200|nr:multicopper oxidase domain-containing protein [Mycolicibacterium neoaurum]QVI28173.1 multicopper oxidase domain-containing protein [Mycolicibacterium neoaurum]